MPRPNYNDGGEDKVDAPDRYASVTGGGGGGGGGGGDPRSQMMMMMQSGNNNNSAAQNNNDYGGYEGGFQDGDGYEGGFMEDEGASDLAVLEQRLDLEVDKDFFVEPRRFHTLQRVIDVLGNQINNSSGGVGALPDKAVSTQMLESNSSFQDLKKQEEIVENAIEHMAVIYCADLNGSVIQVGHIARQFNEAVDKVRVLRRQVRDIQETIGAASRQTNGEDDQEATRNNTKQTQLQQKKQQRDQNQNNDNTQAGAAAMSLRELWLKKLECEAVLSLLDKLDIIRAAPGRFDYLVQPPNCRIGAAVLCLSQALSTMFSDDVAQVQALNKILEQLMLRKQKAEELIWDILHEVIYLRTANFSVISFEEVQQQRRKQHQQGAANNNPLLQKQTTSTAAGASLPMHGIHNPFFGRRTHFTFGEEFDDRSINSQDSGASLFSVEHALDQQDTATDAATTASQKNSQYKKKTMQENANNNCLIGMMVPIPMVEAQLDLEADERRCLEEVALSNAAAAAASNNPSSDKDNSGKNNQNTTTSLIRSRKLPRYADPVLALRILVESLAQLQRLDDVERVLSEGVEQEIRGIIQREQARTFAHLENPSTRNRRNIASTRIAIITSANKKTSSTITSKQDMKHFRRHLTNLLSAFGCIILRLSHLAQILRYRIGAEKDIMRGSGSSANSTLHSVLQTAETMMQKEITEFLRACLEETDTTKTADQVESGGNNVGKGMTHESGLFSLGILDDPMAEDEQEMADRAALSTASRTNVMQMSTEKFVSTILFPRTKTSPQFRHALTFRRILAKWTHENDVRKRQLASVSGQDTSVPSYNVAQEERAIEYLDNIIRENLLPAMQEEAVNGTVSMLERTDAFDPVLDRNIYGRQASNGPMDVDMCKACQALHGRTEPLFAALHRLPMGDGEMYLPVVAVLEHVILTFISRVKQQYSKICSEKTALRLLLADKKDNSKLKASQRKLLSSTGKQLPFATILENRWSYKQLLRAYAENGDDSMLDDHHENATAARNNPNNDGSGISPLTPSANDTNAKTGGSSASAADANSFTPGSIESEEHILGQEMLYMKAFLNFAMDQSRQGIVVCTDEELMKASCLAHSLLKLSSQLENRLRIKTNHSIYGSSPYTNQTLTSTRALREAIKTIKMYGIRMAKFCRMDMLMQTITRLAKICKSSTLVARDAVRIPSSVNDLGEYLTGASDNLREASGNAITAYTFSSLEQYIPVCLMENVRVLAREEGIVTKSPLTMNGIEALDRSGSVLYRDLKGATSFDDSFWDVELAAISFERSASFIAMMELQMDELVAYFTANSNDFSREDFELMFTMDGPRRTGDLERWQILQKHIVNISSA